MGTSLIIAMQKPLVAALLKTPIDGFSEYKPDHLGDTTVYRRCAPGASEVLVAWATDGSNIQVSLLANRLSTQLKPSQLALCGFCAGNPDSTSLGDVIFADRSLDAPRVQKIKDLQGRLS